MRNLEAELTEFLVAHIHTTEERDDMSRVFLTDSLTPEQRAIANGKPYDEGELRAYPRLQTRHDSFVWRWSRRRAIEDVPTYLARQATEMLAVKGTATISLPWHDGLPTFYVISSAREALAAMVTATEVAR